MTITEKTKQYRAVIHNPSNGLKRIESIWFDDKILAEESGERGMGLYGGKSYTVENNYENQE